MFEFDMSNDFSYARVKEIKAFIKSQTNIGLS